MNKFRLLYFICLLFLTIFAIVNISPAQITAPIPEPIKKSELQQYQQTLGHSSSFLFPSASSASSAPSASSASLMS